MSKLEGTERRNGRVILLVTMITLLMVFIIPSHAEVSDSTEGSWEIWLVPNKYTINKGETLVIAYGITGFGDLDPTNIKITAYSEETTLLRAGKDTAQYDSYTLGLNASTPKDIFRTKRPGFPGYNYLISDQKSDFAKLYVIPSSSGDKKITLIATYLADRMHWKTTSRELNYHVNSWEEQHQTGLTILVLLVAIFTLILTLSPDALVFRLWGKIFQIRKKDGG